MTDQHAVAPSATTLIRNEPVQARSTARLTSLLDAAAEVVDRIGYERLTTAMVAEGAGASIGTVYRYFPDRIAVLQALAARNVDRVAESAIAAATEASGVQAAVEAVVARLTDAFRRERGFASLRFGDVLDLRPPEGPRAATRIAESLHAVLAERFGVATTPAVAGAVEAALVAADALLAAAFAREARGDAAFLAQAALAANAILAPALG